MYCVLFHSCAMLLVAGQCKMSYKSQNFSFFWLQLWDVANLCVNALRMLRRQRCFVSISTECTAFSCILLLLDFTVFTAGRLQLQKVLPKLMLFSSGLAQQCLLGAEPRITSAAQCPQATPPGCTCRHRQTAECPTGPSRVSASPAESTQHT